MPEIVTDYPFAPGDRHPVRIFSQARENAGLRFRSRWRGVKCLPIHAWKINLYPTVRVTCADNVIAAQFVVFARQEANDFARRDAECSQHDDHRRRKVFAMAGAGLEKTMG